MFLKEFRGGSAPSATSYLLPQFQNVAGYLVSVAGLLALAGTWKAPRGRQAGGTSIRDTHLGARPSVTRIPLDRGADIVRYPGKRSRQKPKL